MQQIELRQVQRLVVHGYSHLPCAAYIPLRIADAGPARAWLARQLEHVASADPEERVRERQALRDYQKHRRASGSKPDVGEAPRGVSLAFTYQGLGALGLPIDRSAVSQGFLSEFRSGMSGESHRVRVLGDQGESAPEHWRWGNAAHPVHVLFILFAADEAAREFWLERELAQLGGMELVDQPVRCALSDDGREPFGFRDGLSQPVLEGSATSRAAAASALDRIPAGEFVLGYRNAFSRLPASPHLPESLDPGRMLPHTGVGRERASDFGRNGSYLVARQLAQDVDGFHRATQHLADQHPEAGDAREIEARMIGRRHDGTPLAPRDRDRRPDSGDNDFDYWKADRYGYRCPLGAHIRRSNPRNSLASPELGVSARRARQLADHHRLIRRGRPYRRSDGETGLMFLCLQANIERQFEFVQQSWLSGERFAGLEGERDPIAAGRSAPDEPPGHFTLQQPLGSRRLTGLSHYVTVKAGAYFFLPSLSALRYLSSLA